MHITDIDIFQARVAGDLERSDQRLVTGLGPIRHAEIGMKGREVNRYLISHRIEHPIAHPPQFIVTVVGIRNHQIRQFDPAIGFAGDIANRVQDRIQVCAGQFVIKVFRERFQVDVRGVHRGKELTSRLRRDVTGGDCDGFDVDRMAGGSGVDRVFGPDHWIVVSKRDAAATRFLCRRRDVLRGRQIAQPRHFAAFGDVPVLTEFTAKVAAGCSETKHRRTGQKVIERFFLDRVDTESGAATIGVQHHPTIAIGANKAKAAISRLQATRPWAKLAQNSSVRLSRPPAAQRIASRVEFDDWMVDVTHLTILQRLPDNVLLSQSLVPAKLCHMTTELAQTPPARTPLDSWHREAGARMVPFAGYEMPIQYSSIVAEHMACRRSAALFDVSHMGRLRFDGAGSEMLLDHLLSRRVSDLPVGGVRYALMCNADGGVLDDVLVSHLETPSQQRYHLLVVNASNRAKILKWIEPHLADFPSVTMSDRTELTAMIAVQGPQAIGVCKRLFDFDLNRLKYYRAKITSQFSKPVILSRTGYTGEDGFEMILRAEEATRVWENVLLCGRDAGFVPAGLGARDTLRLEAAMPLYGHELDESIDPISAGLSFACTLQDRSFIGDEALRAIAATGPKRKRIGLLPAGKRPGREGCPVLSASGKQVGRITSGGPSPTLGIPIAMAYVDREHAEDSEFQIDIRGKTVAARRTPLPFYRRSGS